jgi:SepF-like predicted cell division protein (DUF552 family)
MRILITSTLDGDCAYSYEKQLQKYGYKVEERNGYNDARYMVSTIEINSLEDLVNLQKDVVEELIVDFTSENPNHEPFIEIYDNWRE